MKTIFTILISILSLITFGQYSIQNYKLGDVCDTCSTTSMSQVYNFRSFDLTIGDVVGDLLVYITPNTHIIYNMSFFSHDFVKDEDQMVFYKAAVLNYGLTDYFNYSNLEGEDLLITVYNSGYKVLITLLDYNLMRQYSKEEDENLKMKSKKYANKF
jgi:hypothetical protein